jgi:predicted neuraminidase
MLLYCLLPCVPTAETLDLPPVSEAGEGPVVNAELIYPLDGRPTPECHASTIVQTPQGLVAAWFGGQHERNPDVGIWISRHDGQHWSAPSQVVDGSEGESQDWPCWNPVLFQPREGPLLLFYKVGPTPAAWWGMLVTSDDGGQTWSTPRRLGTDAKLGEPNPNLIGPVKNKPVQLANGAILCPSSTEHSGWRVHLERTSDLGRSWEVIGPLEDPDELSAIQPSILRYADGRFQILCRSRSGFVAQSWTAEAGGDWSPLTATEVPNPNSGTDAITLRDGRQLLVYNHTTRGGDFPSGRNMLNVALSRDGRSWQPILTLERAPGEYSYPAVIQADNGQIHITYTWRRQSIKHVVLNAERLGSPNP